MDGTLIISRPPVLHSYYEHLKSSEKGTMLMISASATDAPQLRIKNLLFCLHLLQTCLGLSEVS